jgi:hypothetical protein
VEELDRSRAYPDPQEVEKFREAPDLNLRVQYSGLNIFRIYPGFKIETIKYGRPEYIFSKIISKSLILSIWSL